MQENLKELELMDNKIDKEDERLMFVDLFKVEGLQTYLKALMAADIKRYFTATPEQQERIKGNYDRAMQFLIKIQKAAPIDNK